MTQRRIIVTGGLGFIGSALVRHLIENTDAEVLNIDAETYAGHQSNVASVSENPRYKFSKVNICDVTNVAKTIDSFDPTEVIHLAAESHVDRSIDSPSEFIETNIKGTYNLLEGSLNHWKKMKFSDKDSFRFIHVSTDEVYGQLGPTGFFTERSPYQPSSPYSSSKAASDHLARAWHETFGLPTIVTNCSNNFGPYQYPEKFLPVVILNALKGQKIPIYGKGTNVRDWLFVDDHVRALDLVAKNGVPGETYLIGGYGERTNIELAEKICKSLDKLYPKKDGTKYSGQLEFVQDRLGHDFRYAIDPSKIERELGWKPEKDFEINLQETVKWFAENQDWAETVTSKN